MQIDEHKAILVELNKEGLEPSRKMELLTKLGDDYTVTQATLSTTTEKMTAIEKEKNHFAELSQKLWLENSATITNMNQNSIQSKEVNMHQHEAKRTFQDLMNKF